MPVYPVEWLPITARVHYPGMSKHDASIWHRFLDAYGADFQQVAYNLRLGGSEPTDPTASPEEKLMWRAETAKRVDAIVRNDDEIWLCEVRPGAGLAAVGSAVGYGILSDKDPWTTLPIVLTIVTDQMDPDTKVVCEELEIQVIELPELVEQITRPTDGAAGGGAA